MDISNFVVHITSANFSLDPVDPPVSSFSSLDPLVSQYQLELADHIQSFTTTFLSSQSSIAPTTKSSILSLSTSSHPPPPPPRRIRGYIDGCYDILHSGHYNAIRQARSLCDELILGIHSDAEIAHHKGPTVMNDSERVDAVKSCKWIDCVVFGVPYEPSVELLDALHCDFCVHGDDQSLTATGEDAFAKVKAVGRMKIVKRTEGISTTDLVRRLLAIGKSRKGEVVEEIERMSSFLPVSFRVGQFTNHRIPTSVDRVIYIAGDFDLFHVGHIDMLLKARQQGTFLYVGVYEDEECQRLRGRGFPVMSLFERVLNVLACKWVDEVVMGVKRRVTNDMRRTLNIHAVIDAEESERMMRLEKKGKREKEWGGYEEAKAAGVWRTIQLERDLTTEDVVERILENREKYEKRNLKRNHQEKEYFSQKIYVEERRNR